MLKTLLTFICLSLTLSLSGCFLFRDNIEQGNLIEARDFARVTRGMSKQQVRYLVGSPVQSSTFNDNHWDYVYYMRKNNQKPTRQHVDIFFKNNTVTRIDRSNLRPQPKAKR